MMSRPFALCVIVAVAAAGLEAQSKKPIVRQPALTKAPAVVTCPSELGIGLGTKVMFCDVLTGRDPATGIMIAIPPHRGNATLTFNLHNRHTYSEEEARAGRAYVRYTATVGVLTPDNTLLARGVVQSEFRTAEDRLDRIGGGAGPGGVKAVAPVGSELITVTIPATVNQVSLLGERLVMVQTDGSSTYSAPGRPIAVVSNVQVEYRPGPAPRARTR